MKKNFTLFDYQKEYFARRLAGSQNPSYYDATDKQECDKFWKNTLDAELKKRKSPDKADKKVKFTIKLSKTGGGGSGKGNGAGGCLLGFSYTETPTVSEFCLCALNYEICAQWN